LWLGIAELLAGALVHSLAQLANWPPLDFLGLALILRGLALARGGREWARGLMFPILFLFFMFPLPVLWTSGIAVWLQDIVSQISGAVLGLFWVCHQRGSAIYLAGLEQPLVVAEECSGLRQIVAFVALAAFLGELSRSRWLERVLLLLAAVPAAIAANVLRVLLMGIGARTYGPEWLHGWMHDLPALLTLPVGLGLLLLAAWILHRLAKGGPPATEPRSGGVRHPAEQPPCRGALAWLAGCLALAVLGQWGLHAHLHASGAARYPELSKGLAAFPTELADPRDPSGGPVSLGAWSGREDPDAATLPAQIRFADDLISRTYQQEAEGPLASLYVVYSEQGKDREHHPEICIRDVGGAPEDRRARATLFLDPAQQRPVQRFRFRTGVEQYVFVYYWHYTLDPLPQPDQSGLQILHQRLSRRAPSVTVQVSTNARPDQLDCIEQAFLVAVDRALQQHCLPANARIGCDRLPIRLTGGD
jgi:exosortase